MEEPSKARSKGKALSKFVILVVVIYLATYASLYGLRFVMGTEYPIVVVEGVSMEKTYYDGDLAVLRGIPKENIKIGDVIVYQRAIGGLRIIHRVVDKRLVDGKLYFVTQGDNRATNPYPDPPVPAEAVIGVVMVHVPVLGGVVLTLQSPIGLVFSGVLIVLILLLDVFSGEDKLKKRKAL